MQQELVLLKEIIAESALDDYNYDPESGSRRAKKSDYENCDVIPVSDPNAATMAQKIVQYQAVLQLAQSAPQMYNMPLLHRQMLDVLGIKNAQKLIPMSEDQKPMDPVSENQNILMGKPVKAFLYQDHEAHITVHMTAMNDPKIQQLLQGNPMAQAMQAQMMAHINEHLGFEYRKQIELQLGMNLPPQHDEGGEDVQLDPMVEARLAPLLAQASKQLLQSNQSQFAQQQAQQQAQDPIIQMQQQELQLKAAEQQRKVQKDQVDAQLKMKQLEIEHERIVSQAKTAEQQAKIGALKSVADNENQRKLAEVRLKQDSLKTVANLENQRMVNKQKLFADGLKTAHTVNKEKPTKGEK